MLIWEEIHSGKKDYLLSTWQVQGTRLDLYYICFSLKRCIFVSQMRTQTERSSRVVSKHVGKQLKQDLKIKLTFNCHTKIRNYKVIDKCKYCILEDTIVINILSRHILQSIAFTSFSNLKIYFSYVLYLDQKHGKCNVRCVKLKFYTYKMTLKIKYFFMKKSDPGNNDTTNDGYIIKI